MRWTATLVLLAACGNKAPDDEASPPEVVDEAPQAKTIPVTSDSPEAIAAFERGRRLQDNIRPADAIAAYDEALALDPEFAQAHAWRGTLIEGGEFESMVPSRARAAVDIRLPPGTAAWEVLAEVEDRLAQVRAGRPGLEIGYTVKNNLPAAMINPDHPLARLAQKHAAALFGREYPVRIAGPANEGYMLIEAGIPTLPGFGPVGGNAHAPDEWISLESLPVTVAVYAAVIRDYLDIRS